jgi:hypothetical protein
MDSTANYSASCVDGGRLSKPKVYEDTEVEATKRHAEEESGVGEGVIRFFFFFNFIFSVISQEGSRGKTAPKLTRMEDGFEESLAVSSRWRVWRATSPRHDDGELTLEWRYLWCSSHARPHD